MTSRYALTYVEIDVAAWVQSSPDSPSIENTFRFAIDHDFLPRDIDAIPSIKDVKISPATVSLGADLGQRASVTITFRDHRHQFAAEDFNSGTFWGKFRARYGLKLRGHPLRLIRGALGQTLDAMETRHFVIDSADGPNSSGEYKLIAKDVLKFADGDRAQAPLLSNGSLVADLTAVATAATLAPPGIGDAEYPTSGFVAIGGSEICGFTRSPGSDVLTFLDSSSPPVSLRGQFNTQAQTHNATDRVQLCLRYNGADIANIIADLLVTYSDVPASYINLTEWTAETAAYLGVVYTALIAEPTDVDQLLNELIEQAALAIWWDDINQKIRLQVLRPVGTIADVDGYHMGKILQGTLDINEQASKRLSQVYVYFGKINPLVKEDQIDNYRSTVVVSDPVAEFNYGSPAIKKIYSRWIPSGGRITAQTAANKLLGRYVDPPRRFTFELLRDAQPDPQLGAGCHVNHWQLQDVAGNQVDVPIQIYRLTPDADAFTVEAEEMLWTPYGTDVNPNSRTIVFDADEDNINLRTRHDQLYPAPVGGNIINAIIYSGVRIGSSTAALPAFDVGDWSSVGSPGVTINLIVLGRIEGHAGDGGKGGDASFLVVSPGAIGTPGGPALYTRHGINLTDASGQLWGGGGGGGGGGSATDGHSFAYGGGGGGGGAGKQPGAGGAQGFGSTAAGAPGTPGDFDNPGGGGGGLAGIGAPGGGPGLAGGHGANGGSSSGAAGGAAGAAIDGISFVTPIGLPGDRRGGQIN